VKSMRPNILWILTDEQRTDSVAAYGSPWAKSPHLDRLAERGVLFRSAYTPSPVCVPARAAVLTGRACSSIGVYNNHHCMPPSRAFFLTGEFSHAGYQVASFGKQHYSCPARAFPLQDGWVLDERVGYYSYLVPVSPEEVGIVRYPSEKRPWIFAGKYPGPFDETPEMRNVLAAVDWLRARDPDRPFFLRVSLNAPHTPVVAPEPYDTCIDPESVELPIDSEPPPDAPEPVRQHLAACAGAGVLTEPQILRTRQAYYGRTAFVDAVVGRLLHALDDLGVLENTIIAFHSDHGCHLADHGFYQKQSFYEPSVTVPFLLAGPGIASGLIVDRAVSIGSLLPTLLDLAGLEAPQDLDYPSLADAACGGGAPSPEPVFSEIDFGIWDYRDGDRYVMVREGPWKLAVFRDPRNPGRFPESDGLMLHNLEADPRERTNLAHAPEYAEVRKRLLDLLAGWDATRPRTPPPCVTEQHLRARAQRRE